MEPRLDMPEETLFRLESERSRSDIAQYLRSLADKLDGDGAVSFVADDESAELAVPSRPTFEVEAERETPAAGGNDELSIELEIEWTEGSESLDIE